MFILAARGGSKTYDLIKVCLYFASLGFHVFFFSAQASMMAQPKRYMTSLCQNTFLKYTTTSILKEQIEFKNGGWFGIRNLTEGQIRGLHIDMVVSDEESWAEEEALNALFPTLSTSRLGLIRHMTTPLFGSPGHSTWKRLIKEHPENCLIRYYTDCPYISEAAVEHARRNTPDWHFRQEYLCEWIAASGRIFTNVQHKDFSTEIAAENRLRSWIQTHDHAGVDWNPVYGHVMVWTRYDRAKTTCFVTHESNLGTDMRSSIEQLFEVMLQQPKMLLEMEDGGTNTAFCEAYFMMLEDRRGKGLTEEQYMSIARRSYRRPWDSEGKNKMKSITNLYPLTIMVDDTRTPQTAEWLDKASWDKEDTSGKPHVLKDAEMHWFDAFLHASWVGMYG